MMVIDGGGKEKVWGSGGRSSSSSSNFAFLEQEISPLSKMQRRGAVINMVCLENEFKLFFTHLLPDLPEIF